MADDLTLLMVKHRERAHFLVAINGYGFPFVYIVTWIYNVSNNNIIIKVFLCVHLFQYKDKVAHAATGHKVVLSPTELAPKMCHSMDFHISNGSKRRGGEI